MKFYIKAIGDVPFSEDAVSAWYGYLQKGGDVRLYEDIEEVPVDRSNMVIGDIEDTEFFFNELGIYPDIDIRYPRELRQNEDLWKRNLMSAKPTIHNLFYENSFVKPLENLKEFEPFIGYQPEKIGQIKGDIILSDIVNFVSEYRCFILYGEPIGIKHYLGDQTIFPNCKIIKKVTELYKKAPCAYSLDIGVLDTGETAIVEFNDAWACGSYGLEPRLYTRFLSERWIEILRK